MASIISFPKICAVFAKKLKLNLAGSYLLNNFPVIVKITWQLFDFQRIWEHQDEFKWYMRIIYANNGDIIKYIIDKMSISFQYLFIFRNIGSASVSVAVAVYGCLFCCLYAHFRTAIG